MHKLFKFLVNKADTFNLAKKIHSRILSIDTHTDTPLGFKNGYSVGLRKDNMVSIPKMEEGSASVPVLAWSTVLTAAVCAVGGALLASIIPAVSYTHLDVYKRQRPRRLPECGPGG